jgi:L-alanine-DL-glutamate epimerase-like enolase superfamily enzyme
LLIKDHLRLVCPPRRRYNPANVNCDALTMKSWVSNPPGITRRGFLKTTAVAGLATRVRAKAATPPTTDDLHHLAEMPVLEVSFLKDPVRVASVELLRNGGVFLVRVRSTDGAEAITVPNPSRLALMYPLFLRQVAPFFVGKDARDLERWLWEVYRHDSNYKLQGLALWVCAAAIEMALLELMAQTARRPLADFFGGSVRRDIPVYVASGNRGNSPEAELAHLQKLVAESGAAALKFRLGGRMSRNADSLPGRSEALIPKARAAFGEAMVLYADANSSYDVREGIRIGRLLQAHGYGFYEEPCEFDDLWSTKAVADALKIPIAGGEQEFSLHRWRWMIANRAVDIVQPDLHYGGGLIRATQVARMAAVAGMKVVPHMSGGGLGYLDVVQFASFTPNIGEFMEFKGNTGLPVSCATSSLKCERGVVRCPSGPGFGVTLESGFVNAARKVEVE